MVWHILAFNSSAALFQNRLVCWHSGQGSFKQKNCNLSMGMPCRIGVGYVGSIWKKGRSETFLVYPPEV